ncbi:MAG: VOC family protein [Proteobacteria bacterium]|jgi:glyoxylase I family protein|nr:VOC family protein [Pseudomonadota bacterium]MDA1301324.1 VOC family protein [Pseudomonadota bacterium]
MKLNAIHHVSINVDDIETASRFYIDVLGCESLDRPDLGFPGAWLQVGGQQIHLMQIKSGKPLAEQHFAFHVDDLETVRRELGEAGVKLSPSREIAGVCVQAFAHDPSGNMVEFNQRL